MLNKDRSLSRSPLWIIGYQDNRMDVLTTDLGGEEALPVFSFEEEVETFLRLQEPSREGLRARKAARRELVSVLYGPCAQVRWVLLDPLPPRIAGKSMLHLISLGWEEFVQDFLIGETSKEIAIPDYVMWDFVGTNRRGTLREVPGA